MVLDISHALEVAIEAAAAYRWLVDPNDGTASYRNVFRFSAQV